MPSASKSSVESPGRSARGRRRAHDRTTASSSPPAPSSQSGRPDDGQRGLPAAPGRCGSCDTPGYGCETGPGNQRSSIATGKLDSMHEAATYVVRRRVAGSAAGSMSCTSSIIASAIRRAPYSVCAVLRVVELEPLVDRVVGAALGLGGADRVLGEDRHAAGSRGRRCARSGAEVVGARSGRCPRASRGAGRVVDEVRERLRVARVGDVVEAHDRQVVVGVGAREAGRACRRRRSPGPNELRWSLSKLADRGADADRRAGSRAPARRRAPCAARSSRRSGRRRRPGTPTRPRPSTSSRATSGRA